MRIVSWNLHGAAVPGRSTTAQQHEAWAYMREELKADLVLAQEVAEAGIPDWARTHWDVLAGEGGRFRKNWRWGSVIAAMSDLGLREHTDWDPWLTQLYDLVLVAKIDLPGPGSLVLASVHTAAMSVPNWIKDYAKLALTAEELASLQRPGTSETPYINDLAFTALARTITGGPFLVAGDWNTCRQYAGGPEFFERARSRGWVECHPEPEQQSYFGKGSGTYQLDHAFCDAQTALAVTSCVVHVDSVVCSLSDHAPLVLDLSPSSPRPSS